MKVYFDEDETRNFLQDMRKAFADILAEAWPWIEHNYPQYKNTSDIPYVVVLAYQKSFTAKINNAKKFIRKWFSKILIFSLGMFTQTILSKIIEYYLGN